MHARFAAAFLAATLLCAAVAAFAAPFDAPTFTLNSAGAGKFTLTVTAGSSGMPSGFSVYWMTQADYDDYGDVWPSSLAYPTLHWANFTGTPTLNTFGGAYNSFILGPNQSIKVEVGDLLDETGVTSNSTQELDPTQAYVGCAYADAGPAGTRSDYSLNISGSTNSETDCQKTQGFWKNHPETWQATSLLLGTVLYNQSQLLAIFGTPAGGNGLIFLAHQLIAAKLNIAAGANPAPIAATIAAADALIGGLVVPPVGAGFLSPASTSALTQTLDDFNNGIIATECGSTSTTKSTWGRLKSLYR
jgi:hypothetical protein